MSDWKPLLLGDALSISHGFAFPGKFFSDDERHPTLLTPANFSIGGGFQDAKPKTFAGEVPEEFVLHPGELIVTMTDLSKKADTLGYPAIVPPDRTYLHNQRIGRVRVTDEGLLDARFLNYFLRTATYRAHVLGTASGSTVRHTSPGRILSFEASVPPVTEQRAIAEVLGALDDKIAANSRVATTARELMVSLTSLAQGRCELRDVVERVKSSVKPEELGDAAVDHFSLPAFDADEGPELVRADAIKSNKTAIAQPSVLLSKLNPRIPRVWDVVTVSERPSLGSTEFLVLEPQGVTSSVLWAVLSQPGFWSELSGMVAGTSGSHQRVRPDDVMAVAVIDPRSISERRRGSITALGKRVHHIRAENVALASTRDALLPLLMSGRVTVKDAETAIEGVA